MSLSINTVEFSFGDLPTIHKKLLVRVRAYTECTVENRTIQLTLSGDSAPTVIPFTLTSFTETVLEA